MRGIRTPNHQRTRTLSIRFQGGQGMVLVADSRTSRRVTCGINLMHENRASRTWYLGDLMWKGVLFEVGIKVGKD